MSRAFNLFTRYSPDQLKARLAKITGNPRNRALPGAGYGSFKRAPTRQIADINLALQYHATDRSTARKSRALTVGGLVLAGLTIGLQFFWSPT
jgi:hypothetical protein